MNTLDILFFAVLGVSILLIVSFLFFLSRTLFNGKDSDNEDLDQDGALEETLDNEVIEGLKKIVNESDENLVVLKSSSVYTKQSYQNAYPNYYKLIEDKLKSCSDFTYTRIIQLPINIDFPSSKYKKSEVLDLMVDHVIMNATLEHISNCIEFKDRFKLYIIPAKVPYSLIYADQKNLYRKIDKLDDGNQNFNELQLIQGKRAKQYNIQFINNAISEDNSYSKEELLEGVKKVYISASEKLDSKKEKQEIIYDEMMQLVERQFELLTSETKIVNAKKELAKLEKEIEFKMKQVDQLSDDLEEARDEFDEIKTRIELFGNIEIFNFN